MPCKNANPLQHAQIGVVRMSGRFRPNGSSAVDASLKKGIGYTPSYVSSGLFRVTLDEVGVEAIAFGAHLSTAANTDKLAKAGAFSLANKTLDILTWDISDAAAADPASDADTWIHWWIDFQNTSKAVG